MSEYIHKKHNVSVLLYYFVCPDKYRRVVFGEAVDISLKEICLEISKRYDIAFIEIGTDQDYVHFFDSKCFFWKSDQNNSDREVKSKLWGGEFWSQGFYVNTVGKHGNENTIQNYVKSQGKEYKKIHGQQLSMF